MRVLDLFSGIGGFSLGLERAGMETVAFCEIDPFCQKVLKKHWPDVPIYDDVRTLDYDGSVDLICGGFPCQPFSVAGKQKGTEDDRHLWPAMFSLIKKCRPRWVIGENVAGFINMALDDVLSDLESAGYTCQAFVIPACGVGAPHRRNRVWIVGHTEHNGSFTKPKLQSDEKAGHHRRTKEQKKTRQSERANRPTNAKSIRSCPGGIQQKDVADTDGTRSQRRQRNCLGFEKQQSTLGARSFSHRRHKGWKSEPDVGRVANGISRRVDRLRSLGNAVVPQIPEIIGRAIMGVENAS